MSPQPHMLAKQSIWLIPSLLSFKLLRKQRGMTTITTHLKYI